MTLIRWFSGTHVVGLSVAVGITLALGALLFGGAERDQRAKFEHRLLLVEAIALSSALTSAGPDDVGRLLKKWQTRSPGRDSAVLVAGMELLGSTKAEDGAPRRLGREEKSLFDLAQQLRTASETNISEGVVRKKLVQFDERVIDGVIVTVPYLVKGKFAGVLQIKMRHPYGERAGAVGYGEVALWLSVFLAAVVLGSLMHWRGNAYLDIPRVVVFAAFLGLTFFYLSQRMETYVAGDLDGTRRVAAAVSEAVRHYGLPAPGVTAASPWDTDEYMRPLGIVLGGGGIADDARAAYFEKHTRFFERSLWIVELLGLGLLLSSIFGYGRRITASLREHAVAYGYVGPALIGMLTLVFFPFLYGISLAFTDTTLFNESLPFWERWIGWDNFVNILGDFNLFERGPEGLIWNYQNFYWTLMVTVIWTISNVTIGVTLGFILAMILNTDNLKGRAIYRVILILPWAIPNYITALIWRGMFHPQFGVINQVLQMLGMEPVAWFDGVVSSFLTGLATNGWLSFPFMMVVILGALQSIPKDMYEAAEVEGATRWQRLRHITLPLLRPTLIPAIVLSVVWTFNMFNIIFLVSAGEPAGANEILITKAYKIAFENYQYAYAAAYSTVIFIILLVYGVFQTRITRATESY